jgi:SAM-dependent methyltransferase
VTDHVQQNRLAWDRLSVDYAEPGRRAWASAEPTWGIWGLPEREVRALPAVAGSDVVELGCGTAYWSAWLARRGARVVAVDNSSRQLATARALQREHRLVFPLVHADAERVPLADARFDLALSEYGASIWCDPYKWLPEAHRLLRPGGRLAFLVNSPLVLLCAVEEPDSTSETLQRPQRGMHRMEWGDGAVEFHLGHGDMFRALRDAGFAVENLVEIFASDDAQTHEYYSFVTADWARKWPVEEIWVARKPE